MHYNYVWAIVRCCIISMRICQFVNVHQVELTAITMSILHNQAQKLYLIATFHSQLFIRHIVTWNLPYAWRSSPLTNQTSQLGTVFSERELTFLFAICRHPSICLLTSVCNVRAPYSAARNFRQCFHAIWYFGHPLTSTENFTVMSQGNPSVGGVKCKRGSQI